MIEFYLNGEKVVSKASEDTPLLWVIRDEFKLKGTKFGCGIAMCGACTVHVNGGAMRSCSFPVGQVKGAQVTTIEGLNNEHPIQKAWVEEQVPQCGYCQSGQIMQAVTLLDYNPTPSESDIVNHMSANLCRCMAYKRIKNAVKRAATEMSAGIYDPNTDQQQEA